MTSRAMNVALNEAAVNRDMRPRCSILASESGLPQPHGCAHEARGSCRLWGLSPGSISPPKGARVQPQPCHLQAQLRCLKHRVASWFLLLLPLLGPLSASPEHAPSPPELCNDATSSN